MSVAAALRERSVHVEGRTANGHRGGLLVGWPRVSQGWWAQTACIDEGRLTVALLPAAQLRPAGSGAGVRT